MLDVCVPECGLYEAYYLIIGEHFCGKSDCIRWIDASFPYKRKRRLKDHKKLQALNEIQPNSSDIFENGLTDSYYPQRPEEMEDVCVYDFVREVAWQRYVQETLQASRSKPQVV